MTIETTCRTQIQSKPSLGLEPTRPGLKLCQNCAWDLNPHSRDSPAVQKTQFDPCIGKIPGRRKSQPTPVLLPGKSHGQRILVDYSPWGCKESGTTERLTLTYTSRDSNPAKPTLFQLRSQTWFQDLMKLWFLMSHCRRNSERDSDR